MKAFLFSAGITQSQVRPSPGRYGGTSLQTWDSCVSAIICGCDLEQAQKEFENWCRGSLQGENPAVTEIKRITGAQFMDHLLTESGSKPLDWFEITERIDNPPENALDDFEHGYWVDVNQAVPQEKIGFDMESLKRYLPEEIRSGLNWSADKQFLFLVAVLSQPPLLMAQSAGFELQTTDSNEAIEDDTENTNADLDQVIAALPEMRDKEAVVLVEARNSVIAAWLWRRFAAGTKFPSHDIRISPCCGIIPACS